MIQTRDAAILGGVFSNPAHAQDAFDTLIRDGAGSPADLDVAFYGSNGQYLLLIAARSRRAEDLAARVLRDHGAAMQQAVLPDWLSDVRGSVPALARARRPNSEEQTLLAQWATLAILFIERRLVQPGDVLALLVASGERPRVLPTDERRRRLREADSELREVSDRLETLLRARHPDLFDRRGRLRGTELARLLSERAGGKKTLSGDELRALEERTDAEAARSASAP